MSALANACGGCHGNSISYVLDAAGATASESTSATPQECSREASAARSTRLSRGAEALGSSDKRCEYDHRTRTLSTAPMNESVFRSLPGAGSTAPVVIRTTKPSWHASGPVLIVRALSQFEADMPKANAATKAAAANANLVPVPVGEIACRMPMLQKDRASSVATTLIIRNSDPTRLSLEDGSAISLPRRCWIDAYAVPASHGSSSDSRMLVLEEMARRLDCRGEEGVRLAQRSQAFFGLGWASSQNTSR